MASLFLISNIYKRERIENLYQSFVEFLFFALTVK